MTWLLFMVMNGSVIVVVVLLGSVMDGLGWYNVKEVRGEMGNWMVVISDSTTTECISMNDDVTWYRRKAISFAHRLLSCYYVTVCLFLCHTLTLCLFSFHFMSLSVGVVSKWYNFVGWKQRFSKYEQWIDQIMMPRLYICKNIGHIIWLVSGIWTFMATEFVFFFFFKVYNVIKSKNTLRALFD